jgi:hypothetical protein
MGLARERTELAPVAQEDAGESIARSTIMLELKVGDRVRSREDGVTGTVMRREHDFEPPRYVIDWDNGLELCPI